MSEFNVVSPVDRVCRCPPRACHLSPGRVWWGWNLRQRYLLGGCKPVAPECEKTCREKVTIVVSFRPFLRVMTFAGGPFTTPSAVEANNHNSRWKAGYCTRHCKLRTSINMISWIDVREVTLSLCKFGHSKWTAHHGHACSEFRLFLSSSPLLKKETWLFQEEAIVVLQQSDSQDLDLLLSHWTTLAFCPIIELLRRSFQLIEYPTTSTRKVPG